MVVAMSVGLSLAIVTHLSYDLGANGWDGVL
jgi:hypothetical protein